MYDGTSIPSSASPVQQIYSAPGKPEPGYWHQGPPEYNVNPVSDIFHSIEFIGRMSISKFQAFGQTIVLENPGLSSGDYVANGGAWQFQLSEPYETISSGTECMNCSAPQSPYWRRTDGGHTLCHQCAYGRQSRVKLPKKQPPAVRLTRFKLILLH